MREYAGHGIGARMHEEPEVPNYVDAAVLARDVVLEPGLCLAIEPMLVAGEASTETLSDGWTVVTRDRSRAAHFEDVVFPTASENNATLDWSLISQCDHHILSHGTFSFTSALLGSHDNATVVYDISSPNLENFPLAPCLVCDDPTRSIPIF